MTRHDLGFAVIEHLEPDIFEITVAPAIEVDRDKMHALHDFLERQVVTPSYFLVNKKNDYSLSLDAMRHVGNHPVIHGIAFLLFRSTTAKIVEMQQKIMLRHPLLQMASFYDRDHALHWMRAARDAGCRSLRA